MIRDFLIYLNTGLAIMNLLLGSYQLALLNLSVAVFIHYGWEKK